MEEKEKLAKQKSVDSVRYLRTEHPRVCVTGGPETTTHS